MLVDDNFATKSPARKRGAGVVASAFGKQKPQVHGIVQTLLLALVEEHADDVVLVARVVQVKHRRRVELGHQVAGNSVGDAQVAKLDIGLVAQLDAIERRFPVPLRFEEDERLFLGQGTAGAVPPSSCQLFVQGTLGVLEQEEKDRI